MGVILRLRNNNIAVVVDFEAIINKVRVKPSDWDSLQFQWLTLPMKIQR